jgi:hypothetical protein
VASPTKLASVVAGGGARVTAWEAMKPQQLPLLAPLQRLLAMPTKKDP